MSLLDTLMVNCRRVHVSVLVGVELITIFSTPFSNRILTLMSWNNSSKLESFIVN
jgi:hypothetical protein